MNWILILSLGYIIFLFFLFIYVLFRFMKGVSEKDDGCEW